MLKTTRVSDFLLTTFPAGNPTAPPRKVICLIFVLTFFKKNRIDYNFGQRLDIQFTSGKVASKRATFVRHPVATRSMGNLS